LAHALQQRRPGGVNLGGGELWHYVKGVDLGGALIAQTCSLGGAADQQRTSEKPNEMSSESAHLAKPILIDFVIFA
jgi:hypothetical protein